METFFTFGFGVLFTLVIVSVIYILKTITKIKNDVESALEEIEDSVNSINQIEDNLNERINIVDSNTKQISEQMNSLISRYTSEMDNVLKLIEELEEEFEQPENK